MKRIAFRAPWRSLTALVWLLGLAGACDGLPRKNQGRDDEGAGAGGEAAMADPTSVLPVGGIGAEAGAGPANEAGAGGVADVPTAVAGAGGVAAAGTAGAAGAGEAAGAGGAMAEIEAETACPVGVDGHCSEQAYASYPGYELALVEDFPTALDLNSDDVFTWSDGMVNASQTSFRAEQISFANGEMIITAEPPSGCPVTNANPGCIATRASYAEATAPETQVNVPAAGVWSGELRTKYNNYRYGRYEVKFRAPLANPLQTSQDNAAGFMATLFVFRSPRNVQWNEIDLELAPNQHQQVQGNVVNATGQLYYPSTHANPIAPAGPVGYDITQEHVYAFTWTPAAIEWFLDGASIATFTGSAAVPIPTLSAKIMMNLWVFGDTTFGPSGQNQYPLHATYDYFRFYKLSGETYPCAAPPGCLPAADKTASAQNNSLEVSYGQ